MLSVSSSQISGTILIIIVAISFAANSTLGKLSYDYGASPLSVLTYRTILAAIAVLVIQKISNSSILLPPKIALVSIFVGVLLATYSYGLMASIEHIPVALAVLIFYLYPVFTSLGAWILGQEKMTLKLWVCIIVAFFGLSITLGGGSSLNLIGFCLALTAAVGITFVLLITNSILKGQDAKSISIYTTSSASVCFLLLDIVVGEFPLPSDNIGVVAFILSGLFYAFSIIGMFIGLSKIGAIKTSLFMNLEPVSSVFFGMIILDQFLSPIELMGAALVILAVSFASKDQVELKRPGQ